MKKATFGDPPKRKVKWRRLHSYICKDCGKKRFSFFYKRAKAGICTKCKRAKGNIGENQSKLL